MKKMRGHHGRRENFRVGGGCFAWFPAHLPHGHGRVPAFRQARREPADHTPGLTVDERTFFNIGLEDFEKAERVGDGPGPRVNRAAAPRYRKDATPS